MSIPFLNDHPPGSSITYLYGYGDGYGIWLKGAAAYAMWTIFADESRKMISSGKLVFSIVNGVVVSNGNAKKMASFEPMYGRKAKPR